MKYPIHNPFRKPVELISIAVCIAATILLICLHLQFPMEPDLLLGSIAVFLGVIVWRTCGAYRILSAQRNLRWLPEYKVCSQDIAFSAKEVFLGRGFWWKQEHSQLLYMARLPQNKHLLARNSSYEWARQFSRSHPGSVVSKVLEWPSRWNPWAPLPPVGGDLSIHAIEPGEREIWSARSERVGHTLVLGTTRVGKTRLAELLITQDIRVGNVVIVFDPKGDATLLKRMYAEARHAGRDKDFYFFHLGYPSISDRYNPIGNIGRITEVATRVAGPIPGEGNSAAFKQFVWLYVNIIARAASALGETPNYKTIYKYAANLDTLARAYLEFWLNQAHLDWEDALQMVTDRLDPKQMQNKQNATGRDTRIIELMELIQAKGWNEDPIANGLLSILANNKNRYQALINSLFPLLEKLTTGQIDELLSPNMNDPKDKRRTISWEHIMDTGGIVYFGLDALSDPEVAAAVGNAAFADLTSTAGRRYKFGTAVGQSHSIQAEHATHVCIHADEFNELIGDEFIPMVNKAGGAGYEVTAYTQTWSDVEARVGNRAKAQQIGGNFNTLIMLRVKNIETAELLTTQLPQISIKTAMPESLASDVQDINAFADFAARSGDRITAQQVPMLQPADLVQLPKGQAFALLEGGQLAKLRLPLPVEDNNDPAWPADLQAVFEGMHAQYQRHYSDIQDNNRLTIQGKGCGF